MRFLGVMPIYPWPRIASIENIFVGWTGFTVDGLGLECVKSAEGMAGGATFGVCGFLGLGIVQLSLALVFFSW